MIRTRGSKAAARAMAIDCRCPPESCATLAVRRGMRMRRRSSICRPSSAMRLRSRNGPRDGSRPRKRLPATSMWSQRLRSWNTISMPGGAGVGGAGQAQGAAVHLDAAAVGDVGAGHDLGQRRFAGGVVADEAEALARPEVEVDAAQRLDRAEGLDDAPQPDARGPGGCVPPGLRLAHSKIDRKSSTFSCVTIVTGTSIWLSTSPPSFSVSSARTAAAPMPAGSCCTTAWT